LPTAWRTPTVKAIARDLQEREDWSLLPILADALEDIGCVDDWLLTHLRKHPQHETGCWALRFVLDEG